MRSTTPEFRRGDYVKVKSTRGNTPGVAEIVSIRDEHVTIMYLDSPEIEILFVEHLYQDADCTRRKVDDTRKAQMNISK